MKIISVCFENLNSLLGQHRVCFETSPLGDTGLFAITGPTGAGKSTLLDAIAVGLYGLVPRHGREVGELVSYHAPGASSEVEFEVLERNPDTGEMQRVRYRSKWAVKRKTRGKDKGELSDDSMELTCLRTNKPIEELKSRVQKRVAELSGLDFPQFVQSVLLAQGAFAKFLKAKEKDRSALLEKMTDVREYTAISVAAYRQADKLGKQVEELSKQLKFVKMLSAEERQALEAELMELGTQTKQHEDRAAQLQNQLEWRRQLTGLVKTIADNKRELDHLDAETTELQPLLTRLADHERAEPLGLPLSRAADARQLAERTADELAKQESLRPELTEKIKIAEAEVETRRQVWQQAEDQRPAREQLLTEAEQQDTAIAQTSTQAAKLQAEHDTAEQEVAALKQAWEQQAQELNDLQQKQQLSTNWLIAHQHERALGQQIIQIQRELEDLTKAQGRLAVIDAEYERWEKEAETARKEIDRHETEKLAAEKTQADIKDAGKPLREAESRLQNGQTPDELTAGAATQQQYLNLLLRLQPLAAQYQEKTAAARQFAQTYAEGVTALEMLLQSRQALTDQLPAAQQELAVRRRIVRQQRLIVDLNAQRANLLTPACDCPLCGAAPAYHTLTPEFAAELGEDECREQEQEQLVKNLETDLQKQELQLTKAQASRTELVNKQEEAESTAEKAAARFAELHAGPGVPPITTPAAEWQERITAETLAQEQAQKQLRRLREVQHQLSELHQQWNDSRLLLSTALTQLTTATQHRADARQQLQGDLAAKRDEEREAVKNYLLIINDFLEPHGLRYDGRESAGVITTLEERWLALQQEDERNKALGKQQDELKPLITAAETLFKTKELEFDTKLQPRLVEAKKTLGDLRDKRRQLSVGHAPQTERQLLQTEISRLAGRHQDAKDALNERKKQEFGLLEKLEQQRDSLKDLQTAHADRQADLDKELARLGFTSEIEARNLLLPEVEAAPLRRRRDQQQQQRREAETALRLAREQYDAQLTLALTDLDEPELLGQQAALQTLHNAKQQRRGTVQEQLGRDDKLQQDQADGQLQMGKLELEHQRWDDLSKLIGSATGDKFSKFAQGLTLAHLVRLANERLIQLTNRYTILKAPNQDLELQIIDHDQAAAVRTMNSLSGGETFLVSLALALGLSELAGHKTRIESLFIDEGFGTLDPDTLNTAIDALEKLQHSGKTIGIISHVAELKDRISTQIQVIPGKAGNSIIQILDAAGTVHAC